ncbi:actin-like protein Arp4p [Cylindrobasidium torrendii FP15055 ss-10]|uniref:Actin-like protein Arp4p n=1 Tax=Cylindrobasidium torrendii FP15055 ss-10 TaxID=1314674 RepID=A0A0D7B7D0_9AGAR|nr:actin-like protein Arp4p [Cylindrobasidium torrendii FP15055 ss-10]
MVQYGGDEVAALVVDIGHSSVRAGYAGDDTPKAIIPTSYGYTYESPGNGQDVQMDDSAPPALKKKFHVGQSGPSIYRPGMEVGHPLTDGLITDFEPIQPLLDHAITKVLGCNPAEHPILVTEPAWNTPEDRERMAEIIFEQFNAPAFYIANTGVLNAFAAGKGNALVIDVGQNMASVTPVMDGFVLRKGLQYSPLAGTIHSRAHNLLLSPAQYRPQGIALFPHQLIKDKLSVEPGQQPIFSLREDRLPGVTESWRAWYEAREVDEWLQSVGGVLDSGWNDQLVQSRPPRQYEFPTGLNSMFGAERYFIGEQYFHNQQQQQVPQTARSLTALLSDSLRSYDVELRQVLVGNVVLTGGGSLLPGFADRLNTELSRTFQHVKIHAPGNPIERRYGGWLGGSILGSLGTFHQLWISKEEWQEHGKAIIAQRCK